MSWSRKKTFRILSLVLSLSFCFALANILLVVFNLKEGKGSYYDNSFVYLLATVYGTGIGCVCFRLTKSEAKWTHALVHTFVLCLMMGGHRKMFSMSNYSEAFHQYSLSMFTVAVYTIQFILSFHFLVFRYGRTPREKAFRSGMHAFLGALTFFICVMDGLLVVQKMALDAKRIDQLFTYLSCLCLLSYGMCTWYLLLNPYFDWRRLGVMSRKEQIGRTPSKSSLRSSFARGGGRSSLRGGSRR